MSKKDYELIAGTLRYCYRHTEGVAEANLVHWVSERLADALAADNPRFDYARFLAACRGLDSTDSAGRKVRYSQGG